MNTIIESALSQRCRYVINQDRLATPDHSNRLLTCKEKTEWMIRRIAHQHSMRIEQRRVRANVLGMGE